MPPWKVSTKLWKVCDVQASACPYLEGPGGNTALTAHPQLPPLPGHTCTRHSGSKPSSKAG